MNEHESKSASAAAELPALKTWADLRTPGVVWAPRPRPNYPERSYVESA
ncbi:MAG: hypothetical protein KGJ23_08120 [Euryarchaeota archaeon]|nr:hypothetical protein [Euryarchaeota archaeon]MDE1836567.1 hypothetical protein [Euryarchaeota archaeon]MDE1879238.1 hypothetical protein [Euryarchaeota archaeon]MDE2044537.1 hypothetical protein [Thermoplasmata archaeon]